MPSTLQEELNITKPKRKFKSIIRRKNKYYVKYSAIPIYEPVIHECKKSECYYCRIMANVENGKLFQRSFTFSEFCQ